MTGLLVFGRTGQIAAELARLAPKARFLGRAEVDLADAAACADAILALRPEAVVNAAAHTAVERAETEPELAHAINAEAPAAMARAAARLGIPFLHLSTDYVFGGRPEGPRKESDRPDPSGVYGASKLAGERNVAGAGGRWAVLRTSWVFSAHGENFVKTMLRLGAGREMLPVVADQRGGPTPAAAVAAACLRMIRALAAGPGGGLYHFAGRPDTTWAAFASEILAQAGLGCRIEPVATADYPSKVRRPPDSRLDCGKIARDFGIARPDWRDGLARVIAELRP